MEHIILSKPNLSLPSAERWLLYGAVILCFLALSAIHYTTVKSDSVKCSQRQVNYRLAAAVVVFVLVVVATNLLPVVAIGLVAAVCAVQVLLDLYTKRSQARAESVT
jgi:beta-lactamase regulating signal transducer with metallopeptidase domain